MSEEAVGKMDKRIESLESTLTGVVEQLQLTQQLAIRLQQTLSTLTGGVLQDLSVKASEDGTFPRIGINVPKKNFHVLLVPVDEPKQSKILTNDGSAFMKKNGK